MPFGELERLKNILKNSGFMLQFPPAQITVAARNGGCIRLMGGINETAGKEIKFHRLKIGKTPAENVNRKGGQVDHDENRENFYNLWGECSEHNILSLFLAIVKIGIVNN